MVIIYFIVSSWRAGPEPGSLGLRKGVGPEQGGGFMCPLGAPQGHMGC